MITVREYSYKDESILINLKAKATEWETLLNENCIFPKNIYVWIKEFDKKYYFKIEIDACSQEIQYEMDFVTSKANLPKLVIDETHFKSFVRNGEKWDRQDLSKENTSATIRAIDDIIVSYEESLNS
jgi:hypothetical protein